MDLTREQILNMTSQELAEATAVHVMGWVKQRTDNEWDAPIYGWFDKDELKVLEDEWNPAEDERSAWEVLSKFPIVLVRRVEVFEGHKTHEVKIAMASAESRELGVAVCRASLLAVKGL